MLKYLGNQASKVLTLLVCTASILSASFPTNAFAEYCSDDNSYNNSYANDCCEQIPYEEPSSSWSKSNLWVIGGAILLGAAAGAAAGAATGRSGHHHGSSSNAGDFTFDSDNTLTFNIALGITAPLTAAAAVSFIVTTPDGRVAESGPYTILAAGTLGPVSIVISDPSFGGYTVGVNIINSVPIAPGNLMISANVVATRNGGSTTILNFPFNVATLGVGQNQKDITFAYGQPPVPTP